MGEVDEIHQSERNRQPAGQHEQQHAIGNPIEQNGQHGCASSPRRRSLPYTDGGTVSDASPLPAAVICWVPGRSERRAGTKVSSEYVGYFFIFSGSLTASNFANSTL